jgi:hypothetical protein
MSNRKRMKLSLSEGVDLTTVVETAAARREVFQTVEKYNGYECEICGSTYVTVDLHEGVTPSSAPCLSTRGCQGRAYSLGYPKGAPPARLGKPLIEWYRPTPEQFKTLQPAVQQHVRRGGLVRRAGKDAPDWVKAIVG